MDIMKPTEKSKEFYALEYINSKPVNYDAIAQIESSGNPKAFNKKSKARGLLQITPIALADWNQMNPKQTYSEKDLFD